MSQWVIEYAYDERAELRDQHRPAHRDYLSARLEAGELLAFGRYDDDGAPGAVILADAETRQDVEALIAKDPFFLEGLVASHTIRPWAGVVR